MEEKTSNIGEGIRALVFLIVGIGLLLWTFFETRDTINFVSESERITGTVVQYVEDVDYEQTTYNPIIEYVNADGETDTFYSMDSSKRPGEVGEEVKLRYNSETGDIEVVGFWVTWFFPILLAFLGLLFTFLGWASFPTKGEEMEE